MGGSTGGAAGGSTGGSIGGGLTIDSLTLAIIISVAILLLYVVWYVVVKAKKKGAVAAPEVKEEGVATAEPEIKEEAVKEEPVDKKEVAVTKTEDELGDDRDIAKRVPFAEKMLAMDKKTQEYYNVLHNMFRAMRKINPRVSSKGVS